MKATPSDYAAMLCKRIYGFTSRMFLDWLAEKHLCHPSFFERMLVKDVDVLGSLSSEEKSL